MLSTETERHLRCQAQEMLADMPEDPRRFLLLLDYLRELAEPAKSGSVHCLTCLRRPINLDSPVSAVA